MYYIHLHGNHGYLYMLLPGNTEWTSVSIEYCQDFRLDIRESQAIEITIVDLPLAMTCTYDFERLKENIREVYQLNKPDSHEG